MATPRLHSNPTHVVTGRRGWRRMARSAQVGTLTTVAQGSGCIGRATDIGAVAFKGIYSLRIRIPPFADHSLDGIAAAAGSRALSRTRKVVFGLATVAIAFVALEIAARAISSIRYGNRHAWTYGWGFVQALFSGALDEEQRTLTGNARLERERADRAFVSRLEPAIDTNGKQPCRAGGGRGRVRRAHQSTWPQGQGDLVSQSPQTPRASSRSAVRSSSAGA